MKAFVKYLYGYSVLEVLVEDDKCAVGQTFLRLYDVAEKYSVPGLASSALSLYVEIASTAESSVQLKQDLVEGKLTWWFSMAHVLYKKADDHDRTAWRQALLQLTWLHAQILVQHEDVIEKLVKDVPGFATELFLRGGLDGKGVKKT